MDDNLREEVTRLHAQVCSGLADPNRILILYTLSRRSCNVSDLVKSIGISQPTTSRHLKVLRDRGMVSAERDGQSVYYTLTDHRIIEVLDLLRAVLADMLKSQAALARSVSDTLSEE